MEKLLKISVIYCCLATTSRKCKITLYGCHSPSQHRKPSLNFDAVALAKLRNIFYCAKNIVSLRFEKETGSTYDYSEYRDLHQLLLCRHHGTG